MHQKFFTKQTNQKAKQQGQTLIETIVACFILVMGITAALGLANYSLGATNGIKQQIVAMGLAREGIEAVKNVRDTNWLKDTLSTDCYNFSTGNSDGLCYKQWMNGGGGNITVGTYSLRFGEGTTSSWSLSSTGTDYGLNTTSGSGVLYNGASGVTALTGNSGFARKITITSDNFAPFDHSADIGPRLTITSSVWWKGKNCTMTPDVNPDKNCSVTLKTYLTNWRVF
ncbi:MAG TPA: type II secretion system protein [Patescibacteria group bacterium]|jgi:type II secretory pathway pseudopilin PulG|nr:type II secretion system protein [Patescibacteria group bacterium]